MSDVLGAGWHEASFPIQTRSTQMGNKLCCNLGESTTKELMEGGTLVGVKDEDGKIPLIGAAEHGHLDVVQYLSDEGDADVSATMKGGLTSLIKAAWDGHLEGVRYFVDERSEDVNSTNNIGETVLMKAAMNGHLEVVRYLAGERGADVNVAMKEGWTALTIAADKGHFEVVRYLAGERGADVNAADEDGWTALMMAAFNGCIEVIRYLAEERGVDVNVTTKDGETALMKAASNGHIEVIRYLAGDAHADVNALNKDGKTAIRLAVDRGHQEIQRILTPFLSSSQPTTSQTHATDVRSSERSSSSFIPPSEIELTQFVNTANVGGEYRAKWLDADAAVKLYIADASHSSFEDELRLWQQLRHPNVVKMYGACNAGPHLQFFVCEYASNGSLIEHVTSTLVEKRMMWKFLHEAALGLEYLHERGIVHGYLRCSNILIGSDGLSKLSNFGLSGATSLASSTVGPIRWQSPEVLKGKPLSFASDVYSLGMCVLEAATGKTPWETAKDSWVRTLKPLWRPETNYPTYFDPACPFVDERKLVWRMCCQDPDKRVSLSSVVYELERLVIKESFDYPQSQHEPTNCFDNYKCGQANEAWTELQKCMEKCSNDQYRQAFNELEKVHERLCNGAHPSMLLAQFQSLFTEFQAVITMTADQTLAMRLSSTSATSNSFHAFHRRIKSLWAALGEPVDSAQEREARWEKQCSELFVSGVSDIYLRLRELESDEEKAAFLKLLQVEIDKSEFKYTPDQVDVMKKALEAIVSKIEAGSLTDLIPDWFIPWYELVIDEWRCLGTGGFGSVYLAKWLDSEVVVKQVIVPGSGDGNDAPVPTQVESWLTSETSEDQSRTQAPADPIKRAEALAMFRREVDIWFGFSHPHVIRLFGACHVGRPFFVCEYATNGTLVSYLKDHPDQLWPKLYEAALGVQYLHARDVVHGDLKGNNIVIGCDLKAKVTDFGLSSLTSDGIEARISAASHWVAPECFNGASPKPTIASDVYSLGMCIVEALLVVEDAQFCLPWGSLDNAAVRVNAKMANLPLKPSGCKDKEWELVKRMCAFEPEKRIKISTVVDELAGLANNTEDSKTNTDTVSASLRSVPDVISAARELLGGLLDSRGELSMYVELWDRLEQVHGLIDEKLSDKCRTAFRSLVVDAGDATTKLHDTNRSLTFLAETTMRCHALRRRLDKFLDAFTVASITERKDGGS